MANEQGVNRKRFEYMHKTEQDWNESDEHDTTDDYFNSFGDEGWELCAAEVHDDGRIWHFKRERSASEC
jgi:hypothetical protein